ncbi:hypothetical protein CDIK_1869 [Cucumispora dikerogammari]|nr:hypothetical protein CDIK_1869 [Cucumispora dikerogammari]
MLINLYSKINTHFFATINISELQTKETVKPIISTESSVLLNTPTISEDSKSITTIINFNKSEDMLNYGITLDKIETKIEMLVGDVFMNRDNKIVFLKGSKLSELNFIVETNMVKTCIRKAGEINFVFSIKNKHEQYKNSRIQYLKENPKKAFKLFFISKGHVNNHSRDTGFAILKKIKKWIL